VIVVLDTNVILSALLSPSGAPGEIVHRWEMDEFELVTSVRLRGELERTLDYPRIARYLDLTQEEKHFFLNRFGDYAVDAELEISLNIIEKHPSDNPVLECALAGHASFIISGDDHLLKVKEYQGIVILPPAGFLFMLKINTK
jgi:putative PIN family toxin of toxin-antitoxin system